ncbi:hypothetical protein EYR36_007162 [Pleurotus pulmonarius]|nr:hypothetical protein EYR36_007162 [Pleurotus pulmonarius]
MLTSLQMVDAFQRLDINSVPRSSSAYAFPSHAGNEEQVAPHQQDGRRTTDSTTVDIVPVETQAIPAVDSVPQSDPHQVIEVVDTGVATPTDEEDNQEDSFLDTGNAVSHVLQEASSSTQPMMALGHDCRSVGLVKV